MKPQTTLYIIALGRRGLALTTIVSEIHTTLREEVSHSQVWRVCADAGVSVTDYRKIHNAEGRQALLSARAACHLSNSKQKPAKKSLRSQLSR